VEAEIPIFFLGVGQNADGERRENGGKVSVCKGTLFIRPPACEKRNYLSLKQKAKEKLGGLGGLISQRADEIDFAMKKKPCLLKRPSIFLYQ
jgi:hypothetical protein